MQKCYIFQSIGPSSGMDVYNLKTTSEKHKTHFIASQLLFSNYVHPYLKIV